MRNFKAPRNVEDALRRKREVADDVTRLQAKLKDPSPVDENGQLLTDRRQRGEFRQRIKYKLEALYAETRFLKDWLRQNATHKPSEYALLGRFYQLVSSLEEQGIDIGEEGESLLSEVEMHVPHAYLFRARGAA